VILALVPGEGREVRHILVRRCPHADNSNDIRVTMSAETNPPDTVDVFPLLHLSLRLSSRSLVGVGGKAEETFRPSLGKCDGGRRAVREGREVIVDSGERMLPVAISSNILGIVHLEAIRS
jgi:hypothetical protein